MGGAEGGVVGTGVVVGVKVGVADGARTATVVVPEGERGDRSERLKMCKDVLIRSVRNWC